jgi:hypothetical protein
MEFGVDLSSRAAERHGYRFSLVRWHRMRNEAGKTTAVRILATLLRPDGGHARVCGHDVVSHAHQVRQPARPAAGRGPSAPSIATCT